MTANLASWYLFIAQGNKEETGSKGKSYGPFNFDPGPYFGTIIKIRINMNFFDICVLVIVGFCLIRGGFKGLIKEVSGIIGVVAGFYGANTYYIHLIPYIRSWIESPSLQRLACFFVLFCAILIAVGLVARLIHKLLRLVFLGWVDRTFGVVFGAAKGILICTVIFIMVTTFVPAGKKQMTGSRTAPYLAQVADAMTLFISRNVKTDFNKQLEGLKKAWKQ